MPRGGDWERGQLCLVVDWHGVGAGGESKTAPLEPGKPVAPLTEVGAVGRERSCHLKQVPNSASCSTVSYGLKREVWSSLGYFYKTRAVKKKIFFPLGKDG